MNKCFKNYKKL